MTDLLDVKGLSVRYGGGADVVERVEFHVPRNSVVALLGANGAGKSTIMKAVAGLIPSRGEILFDGEPISGLSAAQRVRRGVVYVPEGREIVGGLTVAENLVLGGYHVDSQTRRKRSDMVLEMFPEIASKADRSAWRLSGGEQQMLAIGRALMAGPRLLLLDEPSLGLAPLLVRRVFERLDDIRKDTGLSIVLVEQNFRVTMRLSDHVYFLRRGRIVGEKAADELNSEQARQEAIDAYLGAATAAE